MLVDKSLKNIEIKSSKLHYQTNHKTVVRVRQVKLLRLA